MNDSLVLALFLTANNEKFLITHWFTIPSMIFRTEQIVSAVLPLGVLTRVKHRKNVFPL